MSLHETPLLKRYWKKVGGILIEEFRAVRPAADRGVRYIDGVIIRSGQNRIASPAEVRGNEQRMIRHRHITVVQVKTGRLGMYLLGQAFFSIGLMRRFKPASIHSVALCEQDDVILRPLFERYSGCRVVTLADL